MRQNKWIKLTSGLSFKNLKYGFSIALEIYGCKRESSDFIAGNRSPAHQAPDTGQLHQNRLIPSLLSACIFSVMKLYGLFRNGKAQAVASGGIAGGIGAVKAFEDLA